MDGPYFVQNLTRDYTKTMWSVSDIFNPSPPSRFKRWVFTGRLAMFTSQKKLVIIIFFYILWKKYGTMLISQYQPRIHCS